MDEERERRYAGAMAKYREIAAKLPKRKDQGDMSQMLVEHREWEQTRKAATSAILGDDDE